MKALSCLSLAVALALPASAIRQPEIISETRLAAIYAPDGSEGRFNGNPQLAGLFDGDFDVGVVVNTKDSYVIVDFTPLLTNANTTVYISEIDIGHVGNCEYSLYYWPEGGSDWMPVAEAVRTTQTASYGLGVYGTKVKYVFYTVASWSPSLCELQVQGFVSSKPAIVSSLDQASIYKADGTDLNQGGTGGGSLFSQVFDGKFVDPGNWRPSPVLFPSVGNGAYIIIDFTGRMPGGWYVTDILVGHSGLFPFSLYYLPPGGGDWIAVPEGEHIQKQGIDPPLSFGVNAIATKVKYVFDQATMWDYANGHMSEIQVWGMDPDDLPCTHPNMGSVEWTTVEGSATCTEQGMAVRFCPDCGARFTKTSEAPPLGHDYITTLDRPGSYRHFGSGSISCSRCDFFLPCTNTYETASTNGPADLASWGGLASPNYIQFTDLYVTSSDHSEWGPHPKKIIDGNWGWGNAGWCTFWASAGWNNQHVDFVFGTTIDLTEIDISVHNHEECHLLFFDVNDETGEETLLAEKVAPYIPDEMHQEGVTPVVFSVTADVAPVSGKTYYHVAPDGDGVPRYYPESGLSSFSAGTTYYVKSDSDKRHWTFESSSSRTYYVDKTERYMYTDATDFATNTTYYAATGVTTVEDLPTLVDKRTYQTRTQLKFYSTPCKHLRLRMDERIGYSLWSGHSMCIVEMRPYGTVRGAGDMRYRRETIMILR